MADLAAAREDLGRAIMAVYERLAVGRLEATDLVEERTVVKPTPRRYIRHVVGERSVYEDDARIIGRFPAALGTIFDIGAHWGYMAASFRHAGAGGPILSFEPMRAHHDCLDELRRLDGAYDFAPIGLSDEARTVTLYGPVVNGKAIMGLNSVDGTIFNEHHKAHLVSLVGGEIPAAARYRFQLTRTRIEAKRLDDVLSGRRLLLLPPFRVDTTRIAVMKLDVEGHEPAVLAGAASTIRSQRPFVMIESGNRNHAVAEFFRGASYRYAEREGSRLVETDRHTSAANGFWFPAEREADYRGLGLF